MARARTKEQTLTTALQPQVQAMVKDMRVRLTEDTQRNEDWQQTYEKARSSARVGVSYSEWVDEQLNQAAVGWVLTTVFLRFIEDNALFGERTAFISGHTPELRALARDREQKFYADHPEQNYRGYLEHCFAELKQVKATEGLVDDYAAFHIFEPSDNAARDLINFWRTVDEDGDLPEVKNLHDPELSTRFLGDLYQDLSDFAKKKYALLQTPEFVEEFILDRTLTPALEERSLEGFKLIDPTCGSGHFLLGAYQRLLAAWHQHDPSMPPRARANKAMESIHGVDINPFAVAISRFRLIVAFMQAAGDDRLNEGLPVPDYTVLAGDTLFFAPGSEAKDVLPLGGGTGQTVFSFETEDAKALSKLLSPGSFDVVVGNPPYITVKDKALNSFYRERYKRYCKGTYALTVPFMVCFFVLARNGEHGAPAGWVGQITSNSFMKRSFGKPLIENFFSEVDLREVIDSSGAYVPGHGTPTVIIMGRNSSPSRRKVVGVLGIQGEPGVPNDPQNGKVWRSIVEHTEDPGFENSYISVAELGREFISSHPWSLEGGASAPVAQKIEISATGKLGKKVSTIGRTTHTGMDDAFYLDKSAISTKGISQSVDLVTGKDLRDFEISPILGFIFPFNDSGIPVPPETAVDRHFWCFRHILETREDLGGTPEQMGIRWHDPMRFHPERFSSKIGIAFAFVATHNHFVLERGGKVFKQSAPVIKLPESATEDDHLALLGILNSSTACFWLKQNSHGKGIGGVNQESRHELFDEFYEFTGTTLKQFPLPEGDVTERGRRLDSLAQELADWEPSAVFAREVPTQDLIDAAHQEHTRIRELMIAEQEELDWAVYYLYGLTDADHSLPVGEVDGIQLGTRSFEIALARKIAAGETETAWFARHRSTPTTSLPEEWEEPYCRAVEKRLQLIESDRKIRLLEAPEYKRRWQSEPWEDKVADALRDWLLDRLEDPNLWRNSQGMPQPRTLRDLAGRIETNDSLTDFASVLSLWSPKRDRTTLEMLTDLLKGEAVPYLAALRYKPAGMRKHAEWLATWEAQRKEDAGLITADEVPIPPNYTTTDFQPGVWQHRGKLDVPKERFIAYLGAGPEGDPSPMIGWAGWNHLDRGLAIMSLYTDRAEEDAATGVLAPILNGLQQELPWILQWHNEMDPNYGLKLGDYLNDELHTKAMELGIPVEDLPDHNPDTRKRKAR